ncbi:iron complex transport system substrate-binding protein [Paenibacillus sp. PastF-1]|nr:iron complex transport system substrate-binding protein [Paenibacillus sp. PastF-2]MDF9848787.1 iron complex transport system substrate-binding protein [Paenibacillus sp. PastM-2]MDF9855357.1 iron complex transport system substrate-binding protein [Paenibacillus sp. PastF-1]MDH6480767.1 iron complex transport system substrate-binding protein [Paenibacillus sp. PastH-2]MDH6508052.1 iron complex transport system substrate-binding protein [Paenibacillus sp. PastM-3]
MRIIIIDRWCCFLYSTIVFLAGRKVIPTQANPSKAVTRNIEKGIGIMINVFKRFAPILAVLLLVGILSACSSSTQNENASAATAAPTNTAAEATEASTAAPSTNTVYPLTIENYTNNGEGTPWTAKSVTFDKAPEKVVANTQGAAELLIKLGLTDKMVGVAALYGAGDPSVQEEFKKIPVISENYASKELVVGASPDLVLGRADLFADADWGAGTVEGLNGLGIKTYLQNTSVKGATLDSLYKDIEQLGQIFDVQENAAAYIEELKQRAQSIKDGAAASNAKTFAYVSDGGNGAIAVYSGNIDTFAGDVLGLLGLKNSFGDVTGDISKEQLLATNPDVLLLSVYTGGVDPQTTLKAFYADPSLQSLNAIKNKAIYLIDFNQFWGYSYSIFDGAEKLLSDILANQ